MKTDEVPLAGGPPRRRGPAAAAVAFLAAVGVAAVCGAYLRFAPGPEGGGSGTMADISGLDVALLGTLLLAMAASAIALLAVFGGIIGVLAARRRGAPPGPRPSLRADLGTATVAALTVAGVLAAFGATLAVAHATRDRGSPAAGGEALPQPSEPPAAPQGETRTVKVFFSENGISDADFRHLVPVTRTTDRRDVATFVVEQLFADTTSDEADRGLYSPLAALVDGESTCGGDDFTLRSAGSTFEVRFCRVVVSAGIGDDARILSALDRTLRQFGGVERVVVLDRDGRCFGDESGTDACQET